MKVLLEYGHSGHAARDCRLGWFRDGSDGAILLLWLFLKTFLGETSVLDGFVICCNISTKQPISGSAFRKFRFGAIQFIIFSEVLIEDSNGR